VPTKAPSYHRGCTAARRGVFFRRVGRRQWILGHQTGDGAPTRPAPGGAGGRW